MTRTTGLHARAALALALAAVGLLAGAGGAVASRSEHARSAPADPRYAAECGTCHVAYPPRLLPAASWRQVMGTLDRHFGTDASLDPARARDIAAFLEHNAGTPERLGASATPRITETRWFVRKHDEVPAAVWRRASVASAANCAACHTGAESGDFRERNIRIPR